VFVACMHAVMQFPPEEVRCALGERIGLTEQQVQVRTRHGAACFPTFPTEFSSTACWLWCSMLVVVHAMAAMLRCTAHREVMSKYGKRVKPAASFQ
jgi:hypothetical protein